MLKVEKKKIKKTGDAPQAHRHLRLQALQPLLPVGQQYEGLHLTGSAVAGWDKLSSGHIQASKIGENVGKLQFKAWDFCR